MVTVLQMLASKPKSDPQLETTKNNFKNKKVETFHNDAYEVTVPPPALIMFSARCVSALQPVKSFRKKKSKSKDSKREAKK